MPLMQGFPPSPEGQVTLANWRTAPFNSWAFHHVREIVPAADIPNDAERVRPLAEAPLTLDDVELEGLGGRRIGFRQFLADSSTDGIVVLHRGRIVFEHYANGMGPRSPHILMSVSKSMLGLLAGVVAARGGLDLEQPVTALVPEVARTAYEGATVRQLLDMRVGIAFDEDYLATSGPIVQYRKSTNWNPLAPGEAASDLRSFYATLAGRDGPHGGRFHYVSPNTDLLGWVLERATGTRYADLMSEAIWQPLGAAESAYITVDRLGAPRCAGGMCTTTRDLARVGQMLLGRGSVDGRQVVPEAWIADILGNGDPEAWNKGAFLDFYPGMPIHYRSKCYVVRGETPVLFGLGVHGQNLFVDFARDIVIAKQSSQPPPLDAALIHMTTRAVAAITRALAG